MFATNATKGNKPLLTTVFTTRFLCVVLSFTLAFSCSVAPIVVNTVFEPSIAWADDGDGTSAEDVDDTDDDNVDTPVPVPTQPTKSAVAKNTYNPSTYSVASAAARYFDTVVSTGNIASFDEDINVGQAGSVIGFVDKDQMDDPNVPSSDNTGVVGDIFGASVDADNVMSVSYAALFKAAGDGANGTLQSSLVETQKRPFGFYAVFGSLLNEIGFDETTNSTSANFERAVLGNMLYAAWYLSSAVDSIMSWCMNIVQMLNPFAIFVDSANTAIKNSLQIADVTQLQHAASDAYMINKGQELEDGPATFTASGNNAIAGTIFTTDAASELRSGIANIYNAFENMGIGVVVPVMAAGSLVAFLLMLLLRKTNWRMGYTGGKLRRFITRIVFVLIGVPLLGSMYTVCVNAVTEHIEGSTICSDYVIAETLVDFGDWAQESNLSLAGLAQDNGYGTISYPVKVLLESDLEINNKTSSVICSPSSKTIANLRTSAFFINAYYGGVMSRDDANNQIDNLKMYSIMQAKDNNTGETISILRMQPNVDLSPFSFDHDAIRSLITRYTSGEKVEAGSYDSVISASAQMDGWKALYSHVDAYMDGIGDLGTAEAGTVILDHTGVINGTMDRKSTALKNAVSSIDGKFTDVVSDDGTYLAPDKNWLSNGTLTAVYNQNTGKVTFASKSSDASAKGLSNVAMFNYLNTDFGTTGLKLYSGQNSANTQSSISHYAVNSVGNNLYGVLILINSILLMGVCGIVGVVYGIGIIWSTITNGVKLIWSTPFALIGAVGMIAKVLGTVALMCIELLVTCVLYIYMSEFLLVVNDAVVNVLPDMFNMMGGAWTVSGTSSNVILADITTSGDAFQYIGLIVSCLVLIILLFVAIKIRRSIIESVSELINHVIETFTSAKPDVDTSGTDVAGAMGSVMGTAQKLGVTPMMVAGMGAAGATVIGTKMAEEGKNLAAGTSALTGSTSTGSVDKAVSDSLSSSQSDTVTSAPADGVTRSSAENVASKEGSGIEGGQDQMRKIQDFAYGGKSESAQLTNQPDELEALRQRSAQLANQAEQQQAFRETKETGQNDVSLHANKADTAISAGAAFQSHVSEPSNGMSGIAEQSVSQSNITAQEVNVMQAGEGSAVGSATSLTNAYGTNQASQISNAQMQSNQGDKYSSNQTGVVSDLVADTAAGEDMVNNSSYLQGSDVDASAYSSNVGGAVSDIMADDSYSSMSMPYTASNASFATTSNTQSSGVSTTNNQSSLHADESNYTSQNSDQRGTASSYVSTESLAGNTSLNNATSGLNVSEDSIAQANTSNIGGVSNNANELGVAPLQSESSMYSDTVVATSSQQMTQPMVSTSSVAAGTNASPANASAVYTSVAASNDLKGSQNRAYGQNTGAVGVNTSDRYSAAAAVSQTPGMPRVSSDNVAAGIAATSGANGAVSDTNTGANGYKNIDSNPHTAINQTNEAASVPVSSVGQAGLTSDAIFRDGIYGTSEQSGSVVIGGGASIGGAMNAYPGSLTNTALTGSSGLFFGQDAVEHPQQVSFEDVQQVLGQLPNVSATPQQDFKDAGTSLPSIVGEGAISASTLNNDGLHTRNTSVENTRENAVSSTGVNESVPEVPRESYSPKNAQERVEILGRGATSLRAAAANGFFNTSDLPG